MWDGETLIHSIDYKTSHVSWRACGVWDVGRAASATCQQGGSRCMLFVGTEMCRQSYWPALTVFPQTLLGAWDRSASAVSRGGVPFLLLLLLLLPPFSPPSLRLLLTQTSTAKANCEA